MFSGQFFPRQGLQFEDDFRPSAFSNTRSLQFAAASSQYLSRSWGAGGDSRQIMSWSLFFKRSSTGINERFFAGGEGSSNNELVFGFLSTNTFQISGLNGGSSVLDKRSTATFTDTASWHHLLVAMDTTQATAANRFRVYIDNSEITSWGTNTIPAQNTNMAINGYNATYMIGRINYINSQYYDGLIDEFIYVDGQQLTVADFATGNAPKAYAGTFGTKGFRLRFENTGTLGLDDSGNSNSWTLVNTPVTSTDHP